MLFKSRHWSKYGQFWIRKFLELLTKPNCTTFADFKKSSQLGKGMSRVNVILFKCYHYQSYKSLLAEDISTFHFVYHTAVFFKKTVLEFKFSNFQEDENRSWKNDLVVRVLDSQSSLSFFRGRSCKYQELLGTSVVKSRLFPRSGSVALRQLNPSIKRDHKVFL